MCLALPGRIVDLLDAEPLTRSGRVSFGGVTRSVNLSTVPEAGVGDYVLVHAGLAISRLNEAEAEETLRYIEELTEMGDAEGGL